LKDADFSQYVDDEGNIMIPNVAQLVINEETLDSNKVQVSTPQEKPKLLPNTNLNVGNGTGIAVGALVAIGLTGTLVAVSRKGKHEQGE
ncbi:isopeptide-forming domain-containing fimbrial protein, partial [Enterococcus faecalis]